MMRDCKLSEKNLMKEMKKLYLSTDTLVKLAKLVLKDNIFYFNGKTSKQGGTAIGTKFVPPYNILFMAELEEKIIEEVDNKPYL